MFSLEDATVGGLDFINILYGDIGTSAKRYHFAKILLH